jgi:hypothetical protein
MRNLREVTVKLKNFSLREKAKMRNFSERKSRVEKLV